MGGGIDPLEAIERDASPNFRHGVATVVGGILLELPKTVVESTISAPPVAGLVVELLAWPTQVSVVVARGIREMSDAFDPWGIKQDGGMHETWPSTSPQSPHASARDRQDAPSP